MRRSLLAVGFFALAACGTVGPSVSAASLEPVASAEAERECAAISLRAPDGQIVFLSGRWIGSPDPNAVPRPSVFYIRQTNSCVVWVGLSAEEGEALGESWVESFTGHVRPDFTIRGLWEEVPEGGRGAITVKLEFGEASDVSSVELLLEDSTGDIHPIKRWVRDEVSN